MPEQKRNPSPKTQNFWYFLASLPFLVPNLLYISLGWFMRHRADDFCFSGTFRQFGFINGLKEFYLTLSNRFSAFMLWAFSDLFGERAIRLFSIFAIIFLMIAIYIAILAIARHLHLLSGSGLALFISQVLVFFSLYLSPNIHQSVYWRAAMAHYFLPIPILILMVLFVLKQSIPVGNLTARLIAFFLLSLFMAGLSESYAALQGASFALLMLFHLLHPKQNEHRNLAWFSVSAILATLAALLIMIISPGNTLKLTTLNQAPDLQTVISISLNSAYSFIFYTIRGQWLPFGVLFCLGLVLPIAGSFSLHNDLPKKNIFFVLFLVPLVVFILIFAIAAPTAYGMMAFPEKRVMMLALIILVAGVLSEGILLGVLLSSEIRDSKLIHVLFLIMFTTLIIYPLLSISDIFDLKAFYQERAALWGAQQQEIFTQIAQGRKNLVVTALDAHAEIAEMRDYTTFWVNLCTAQYYNVDSISAVER